MEPYFEGPVAPHEVPRLNKQHEDIKDLMLFNDAWYTLREISAVLGYPEASISAQLRHLRKARFGKYVVNKRRVNGNGLWEYQVLPPVGDANV